jgi:transcriptional regulator with XRE-family HTH domain
MRDIMFLHEKLKRLCGQKRWGQTDLIHAVGDISKSTMNNWFNGKSKPDLDSALAIAKALEVSLDWLADADAEFPPPQEAQASPQESAVLKLIRALELDEEEALRRLAGHKGEAWVPGSVRNFTASDAARAREARLGGPNDAAQGRANRNPETGELLDPVTRKPRPKRKGG